MSQWNEFHCRTQLNSKNHTTVHVMDSTSRIPVFVGDPHGIPRTPDRQDPSLLAASNSPLEPEGDDVLMPATGTSAESPLIRESPGASSGAGPGANPGETGSPATVGSRIRPTSVPVAPVAVHPRGDPSVSPEQIAEEFAGRSSYTAAMLEHAQTCSEPLVWQTWLKEAFAVARGYRAAGPGQAPKGGVKDTRMYVEIRNAIYARHFPDELPIGSAPGSERGTRSPAFEKWKALWRPETHEAKIQERTYDAKIGGAHI